MWFKLGHLSGLQKSFSVCPKDAKPDKLIFTTNPQCHLFCNRHDSSSAGNPILPLFSKPIKQNVGASCLTDVIHHGTQHMYCSHPLTPHRATQYQSCNGSVCPAVICLCTTSSWGISGSLAAKCAATFKSQQITVSVSCLVLGSYCTAAFTLFLVKTAGSLNLYDVLELLGGRCVTSGFVECRQDAELP